MSNHLRPVYTPGEIKEFRAQLNEAEEKLIERWKEIAQDADELARIVGGGVTEEDSELIMKCVETCLAQCMLFVTESQLREVEARDEETP